MTRLQARLLGAVEISVDGSAPRRFPTRKSELLFGFLALHRDRFCLRDSLASMLWGESRGESARKCLRTELWRVRSLLEPDAASAGRHLAVSKEGVRLSSSPDLQLDLEELEELVLPLAERPGQDLDPDGSGLERAVALYRGELLAGHDDDWCLYARERYRTLFLSGLEKLMDHWLARGNPKAALDVGGRLLHHDPLLERINRNMMRCYLALGDRAAAMRQYLRFQELLEDELDVSPMPQTRSLFERLRQEPGDGAQGEVFALAEGSPAHAAPPPAAGGLEQVVDELRSTQRLLEQLAEQVQQLVEAAHQAGQPLVESADAARPVPPA